MVCYIVIQGLIIRNKKMNNNFKKAVKCERKQIRDYLSKQFRPIVAC
jgi:hypothetical protein